MPLAMNNWIAYLLSRLTKMLTKMLIVCLVVILLNVAFCAIMSCYNEPLSWQVQVAAGTPVGVINGLSIWWLFHGGRWWPKNSFTNSQTRV